MCPRTEDQFKEMREATTAKILGSAIHLFSEKGFHGASMDAVAKKAKISKGLAYNYFKTKDDILAAIIEKRMKEVNQILDALPTGATPHQQLDYLLKTILNDVSQNIELYRLYFTVFLQPGVSSTLTKMAANLKAQSKGTGKRINRIFENLGFENPELEATLFFSTIQGIAMDFVIAPDAYPLTAMIDHVAKKTRSAT